ncbi:MAG: hypothetical protein K0R13_2711, partial [Propionibacteriaceae bacterium]|nr:hypothetical protein [Propionibacteriaceae bacterium]
LAPSPDVAPAARPTRYHVRPAGVPAHPTTVVPGRRTEHPASWPAPAGHPAGRSPTRRGVLQQSPAARGRVACRNGVRRVQPSISPGRGARVVTETETKISGCCSARRATTVPLPTAVGPETTVRPPRELTSAETAWTGRRTQRSGRPSDVCLSPATGDWLRCRAVP